MAKHVNSNKHLQKLIPGRKKKVLEQPANESSAGNTANDIPAPNVTSTTTEEPRPETFRPRTLLSVVTEPTDSSISLSLPSDAPPNPSQSHDVRHPQNIIANVNRQFRSDLGSNAPSSQASTLQNSTYVNDGLSRRSSETQPPSIPEPDASPAVDNDPPAPRPSQPGRPYAPRIQTNLAQLHVPGSDDEDGHSTIRGGSSSPASAVDFHGMGGHFEPSTSQHEHST